MPSAYMCAFDIRESVDSQCRDGTDTAYSVIHTEVSIKLLFGCSATAKTVKLAKTIVDVLTWKVAKLPNCSSFFFLFFLTDYLNVT